MTTRTISNPRYAPLPTTEEETTLWALLAVEHGTQPAAYQRANLQPNSNPANNKVPCQSCGKTCTKARGNAVLTRSTVVCGKCYDAAKHGPISHTSNTTATHDPATCEHARKDRHKSSSYNTTVRYCLDCWSVGI